LVSVLHFVSLALYTLILKQLERLGEILLLLVAASVEVFVVVDDFWFGLARNWIGDASLHAVSEGSLDSIYNLG